MEIANVRSVLGNRIYFPDKSGDIVIPPDTDNWRQCYECGSIYPRYNVKQESELVDVVEALHNPHGFGNGVIVGVGEAHKFDRTGMRQYKRKRKQDLSYIKDDDLRRELEKGSKLISYEDNSASVF